MASSSSSANNKYDVFLSFSGEDTRKTFVDHLYAALDQWGICTFKDDEKLEKGKRISDELLQAIEDSRVYIIVFSKRYASSSWCLNELLKIMECHKTNGRIAFPVFYDVDPSDVRKQTGSVGEAFPKHKDYNNESEVRKWRGALEAAANLSGWDLKNTANGHEAKLIKLIIEKVSLELRPIYMNFDENLVGIEQRMQDLDSCLEIGLNDVRMIGIKGMGGAGKTTLARAIFDKIAFNFECQSFVENVRENALRSSLKKLQKQILRDVLKSKDITVSDDHEGKMLMKKRLHGKKVLVVLDDVDEREHLEMLVGDASWFAPGSRIIITTRDGQVLEAHRVKWIHDVNLLSDDEAIHLFCRHAFGKDKPTKEYERHSQEVVSYAAGLPLTIKVLGSNLRDKAMNEWRDVLARLKTIPLEETLNKLEISYESLEDDCKDIFLDVACILKDREENDAVRMLESSGFHAKRGLRILEQKSLIVTSKNVYGKTIITMHDHLVEMGMNIVRREYRDEPHKHSRLWIQEEIEIVLAINRGCEARCIDLRITPRIFLEGLGNMEKLKCLVVNNDNYHVKIDEARLHFPYSVMEKLRFLDLSRTKLRSLDLGLTPKLEGLNLQCCYYLVKLDVHGGCLRSLVYLNLYSCFNLKSVSFIKQFESLEFLNISRLKLREFPGCIVTGHSNNSLLELDLSENKNISEIPSSIGNLHNLVSLHLSFCDSKSLPESICSLQNLTTLNLSWTGIEELPEDIGQLKRLEFLDLARTKVKHLPNSICMLKRLKTLILKYCDSLEKLPEDVGELESLVELNLFNCSNLGEIPSSICRLKHLKELDLATCKRIEKLPEELGNLGCLQLLDIRDTGITHLPHSISLLKGLKINKSGSLQQ